MILSAPIQFILVRTTELLEVKAKLSTLAAVLVLRAQKSATNLHQQSRRLFDKDRSQQFASVGKDHIMQGTAELSSQRSSALIDQEVRPASSAGVRSTAHPAANSQANTAPEQLHGRQSFEAESMALKRVEFVSPLPQPARLPQVFMQARTQNCLHMNGIVMPSWRHSERRRCCQVQNTASSGQSSLPTAGTCVHLTHLFI